MLNFMDRAGWIDGIGNGEKGQHWRQIPLYQGCRLRRILMAGAGITRAAAALGARMVIFRMLFFSGYNPAVPGLGAGFNIIVTIGAGRRTAGAAQDKGGL